MSADIELLELAAKAARIELRFVNGKPKEITEHWSCDPTEGPHERDWDWDPLTDDGDALRLAVTLGLEIYHSINCDVWTVFVGYPSGERIVYATEEWGVDQFAATRRAIVEAAAAMGKATGGAV